MEDSGLIPSVSDLQIVFQIKSGYFIKKKEKNSPFQNECKDRHGRQNKNAQHMVGLVTPYGGLGHIACPIASV